MAGILAIAVLLGLLAAATWLVFARPLALICTTVFMLASAPTLQIPVIHVAVIMPLALMCLVARFTGRFAFRPLRPAEIGVVLLIFVSSFSFLGNRLDLASARDFLVWAVMSALIIPLGALRTEDLIRAGRAVAFGAGVGALFGLVLRLADPHGELLGRLAFLGYSSTGYNGHYIPTANGGILRLTGAYLDPNLGGLLMTAGLVFSIALLRGTVRLLISAVIVAAVALTFSRASLGAVVVAALLLVVVGRIPGPTRQRLGAALLLAAGGLWAIPGLRTRLLNSFAAGDVGSSARGAALHNFPGQMSGHWLLGRGFGFPPLIDGQLAYANVDVLPANAPLLSIYRGGIVVGLVFTGILIFAGIRAGRLLRSGSLPGVAIGAGMLGLILVDLQLDIPVVTLAPAVAMLSVCLAFLDSPDLASAIDPMRRDPSVDVARLDFQPGTVPSAVG